ncbi:MAG TPA: sulfur oxidation c-type cytochrome SoxA, partial [Gammaproteobacteria bacterium]|nr:sulfur oxidation c-type cytochrome SoxA [Gammaproteobacteria bacterium]
MKSARNTVTKTLTTLTLLVSSLTNLAFADPEADKTVFQKYFTDNFPQVAFQDFANGVYAIDPVSRAQWEEIEQFPPYDSAIAEGERLYKQAFANGKHYADCLPNKGLALAQSYPKYDDSLGTVVTLPILINQCRIANNEKPLAYQRGEIASLLAYLSYSSRGKKINILIQNEAAKAAYNKGKHFYYARRGQLNMACAHCHVDNAGKRLRATIIGPALGQVSGFPAYRTKWGEMGT